MMPATVPGLQRSGDPDNIQSADRSDDIVTTDTPFFDGSEYLSVEIVCRRR
jgi:hypothetical protein